MLFCKNSSRLFLVEEDELGNLETVAGIARFTDDLCSIALTLNQSHIVIQHMVLNFYEVVSTFSIVKVWGYHLSDNTFCVVLSVPWILEECNNKAPFSYPFFHAAKWFTNATQHSNMFRSKHACFLQSFVFKQPNNIESGGQFALQVRIV